MNDNFTFKVSTNSTIGWSIFSMNDHIEMYLELYL